jgi:hypothetical protein
MQKRVGWNFGDVNRLSVAQASAMLENIDGKIVDFKASNQLHESEKSTAYNGLILAKQVLESYIAEKAESRAQQKAAGAALAAKKGDAPKSKLTGASKAMMKMSKKELEKYAGTKHKGLPEKKKTNESKERPYVAVHAKKGKTEVTGNSSYDAAKKAAEKWKLKSTAGIDVYLADVTHVATESINESVELNESYTRVEQMVDDAFTRMLGRLNAMTKMTRSDGALAKNIQAIGGDPAYLKDTQQAIDDAYDAVEEAHYGALGHIVGESASQGVFEDEVGQAETLMAAQDMVDSIQGMLEDVGEMINEKLPPLTDGIRRSGGAEAAATFNQQTNSALNALMDAVRAARESMASAVGTLSGETPAPMGGEPDLDLDTTDSLEEPASDDADFDLDDFAASDAATGGSEPLGRSKRN